MLSAFTRKFGHAGFFTIYQDYAMRILGLTLTESGLGGTVYGGTAVGAAVLVMISHAFQWNYSKLVSLVVSAALNGVATIIIIFAVDKVIDFFSMISIQ